VLEVHFGDGAHRLVRAQRRLAARRPSLNMTLRKVSKNRSLFPSDEAVFKLLYLALRNISKRWTMPIPNWSAALNQFAILFDGRVPMGGIGSNSLTQNQS
jgi:hypothetical protein